MTRQDAVLIADAAGLSIFALGRDREKFLLALEIFTTMVAAAERRKLAWLRRTALKRMFVTR